MLLCNRDHTPGNGPRIQHSVHEPLNHNTAPQVKFNASVMHYFSFVDVDVVCMIAILHPSIADDKVLV